LTGVLLALAASLSWGLADFGGGVSSRRVPVPLVLAISQVVGLAFVAVLVVATGASAPTWHQLAWGALAGAVGAIGLGAFYRALAVGVMGVVGPISACAAVVPLVYGLARGDRPSTLQAVGIGLAVVGVIAASLEPQSAEGRRISAGVGFALVAALGFGLSLVALSKAANGGVLWGPLSMRLVGAPLVSLVVLVVRPSTARLRATLPIIVSIGVFDTLANVLFGLATEHGLLSVVSVLSSLYPVVLVALARVYLHERIARHQLAGVASALVGVALISAA
jgi:drug/metabolite transporter (DMT)-like permease